MNKDEVKALVTASANDNLIVNRRAKQLYQRTIGHEGWWNCEPESVREAFRAKVIALRNDEKKGE